MKFLIAHIILLLFNNILFAQADTTVLMRQSENKVSFKANLPALTQIPGAPKPFWSQRVA